MAGPSPSSQKPTVVTPNTQPSPRPQQSKRPAAYKDIRQTKEYKIAARRWTATIVALPIFMYTSYVLYDRTYGSKRTNRSTPDHSQ